MTRNEHEKTFGQDVDQDHLERCSDCADAAQILSNSRSVLKAHRASLSPQTKVVMRQNLDRMMEQGPSPRRWLYPSLIAAVATAAMTALTFVTLKTLTEPATPSGPFLVRTQRVLPMNQQIRIAEHEQIQHKRARLKVLRTSDLRVVKVEPQLTEFHLQDGEVHFDIMRDRGSERFVLTTPAATVEVIGTRFSVAAFTNKTRVSVERGTVRVVPREKPAKPIVLKSGQTIEIRRSSTKVAVAPQGPNAEKANAAGKVRSAANPLPADKARSVDKARSADKAHSADKAQSADKTRFADSARPPGFARKAISVRKAKAARKTKAAQSSSARSAKGARTSTSQKPGTAQKAQNALKTEAIQKANTARSAETAKALQTPEIPRVTNPARKADAPKTPIAQKGPKTTEPKSKSALQGPENAAPAPSAPEALPRDPIMLASLADRLRKQGEYKRAIEIYAMLAAQDTLFAEEALYRQASLLAKTGHPRRAFSVLKDSERRYPKGALRLERTALRIRLHLTGGELDTAVSLLNRTQAPALEIYYLRIKAAKLLDDPSRIEKLLAPVLKNEAPAALRQQAQALVNESKK